MKNTKSKIWQGLLLIALGILLAGCTTTAKSHRSFTVVPEDNKNYNPLYEIIEIPAGALQLPIALLMILGNVEGAPQMGPDAWALIWPFSNVATKKKAAKSSSSDHQEYVSTHNNSSTGKNKAFQPTAKTSLTNKSISLKKSPAKTNPSPPPTRNISEKFTFTPLPVKKGAKIAISGFSVEADTKSTISGKTVQMTLEEIFTDDPDYHIISRSQLKKVMDEMEFQVDDVLDKKHYSAFQNKTKADYLLTGTISHFNGRTQVVANLIDLKNHIIKKSGISETFFPDRNSYTILQEIAMMLKMGPTDKKRMRKHIRKRLQQEKNFLHAELAEKERQRRIAAQKRHQQRLFAAKRQRVLKTLPDKRKRLLDLSRKMNKIASDLNREYRSQLNSCQHKYNNAKRSILSSESRIAGYQAKIDGSGISAIGGLFTTDKRKMTRNLQRNIEKMQKYQGKINEERAEVRQEQAVIDGLETQLGNTQKAKYLKQQFSTLHDDATGIINEVREAGINDTLPALPELPSVPEFSEPSSSGRGYFR